MLGPDEVRVRPTAFAVGAVDVQLLQLVSEEAAADVGWQAHEMCGEVVEVGLEARGHFSCGQRVLAVVPPGQGWGGASLPEEVTVPMQSMVELPEGAAAGEVAAAAVAGMDAVLALHYQHRITPGDTLLVVGGTTATGRLAMQLARHWGAKVVAVAGNAEEMAALRKLAVCSEIVDLTALPQGNTGESFESRILQMTGGLGVDCVLECAPAATTAPAQGSAPDEEKSGAGATGPPSAKAGWGASGGAGASAATSDGLRPSQHAIISVLGVGAKWITQTMDLQLDPPSAQLLFLKSASVCFACSHAWVLSGGQQGRVLHMMRMIADLTTQGVLRPLVRSHIGLADARSPRPEPRQLGPVVVELAR